MVNQVLTHDFISENTEAIVNSYVLDYLENTTEDKTKTDKTIYFICEQLTKIEAQLYRREGIHPDTFSTKSILGIEKEYFKKTRLIEDLMKTEIYDFFTKF